jgi:GT2 family glycosyltransferase/ADP-heptose:LPS heptosyltransferase
VAAGAAELCDPNPYFDTSRYLERNPGVAETGANPLVHYLKFGGAALHSPPRRRIQVHRRNELGDVLLITPVLKALRKKYPGEEIVVTTVLPELLLGNPYIDRVTPSRTPREGFDETFILEYETMPDEHIVDAYAQITQVSVEDRTPEIYLRQDERFRVNRMLREAGVYLYQPFCVMQLTSGWSVRDWPIERFKEVAGALEEAGLRVIVLGKEPSPGIDFGVDLRGQTSVRIAAAIIEKCAVMVTIDSALMHMGYALKRVPDWALPTALSSDIDCRGCHHRQPAPARLAPRCLWESVRCMDGLSSELVIRAVKAELARATNPIASIVIPHYIKYDLLHACLSSISRYGAERAFEVIVVVDGSPGDSVEQLKAWRPNVRILALEPNRGFSGACNAGARAARGKYVVFLNDDTTVTPGWLDAMISHIEADPKIGIVGPKLLYPETDRIQHCGTVINDRGFGEHIYRNFPNDFAGANKPRYYRALTGACLLIEKRFFETLREFEVKYCGMGGCDDTDLCFKVLEQGRMVAYCPSSVVYHHEGLSRGLRDEHHPEDTYNRRILRERWSKYLVPDINDYRLLEKIEGEEGKTWRWLKDVPSDIIERFEATSRDTN